MKEALLFWPWVMAEILDGLLQADWTERLVTWIERKAEL